MYVSVCLSVCVSVCVSVNQGKVQRLTREPGTDTEEAQSLNWVKSVKAAALSLKTTWEHNPKTPRNLDSTQNMEGSLKPILVVLQRHRVPADMAIWGPWQGVPEEDDFLVALVAGSLFSSLPVVKGKDACLSTCVKKSSSPQEAGLRTTNILGKKAQSLEGERAFSKVKITREKPGSQQLCTACFWNLLSLFWLWQSSRPGAWPLPSSGQRVLDWHPLSGTRIST